MKDDFNINRDQALLLLALCLLPLFFAALSLLAGGHR